VSLGLTAEKLRAVGVETVGVVATAVDRARRYFRYRPLRYPVGADPELATHRAFGVPRSNFTDEIFQVITTRVDGFAREAGLAAPTGGGWEALDREDGINRDEYTADTERHQVQLTAQFLLDRDGVIRWTNVECARDGLEGLDRFPTDEEFLAAARAL
jgi:hypothetical protein